MKWIPIKTEKDLPKESGYYFIRSQYGQMSAFFDFDKKLFNTQWDETHSKMRWLDESIDHAHENFLEIQAFVEKSKNWNRYKVIKKLEGHLSYASIGDTYYSGDLYDVGYNINELIENGYLELIPEVFPFEKDIVGKNKHSVITICPTCGSQGINMPLEKECGNCGYKFTRTYYDAETIHNYLASINQDGSLKDWKEKFQDWVSRYFEGQYTPKGMAADLARQWIEENVIAPLLKNEYKGDDLESSVQEDSSPIVSHPSSSSNSIEQENSDVPRRMRVDKYVPAEAAIRNAMLEVERLPADAKLTKAVILLEEAKNLVSDFVDEKTKDYDWTNFDAEQNKSDLSLQPNLWDNETEPNTSSQTLT